MSQINGLQAALRTHLPWHGARLTFLALFLVALFRVETVNLDKLSSVFANRAKPESNYKRLTRFLRAFPVDFDDIARAIVSWSQIPQPWTLSLDCTNWSFGSVHFNILMLGIVHEGLAFPLFWTMLDKRGNSTSDERIDLLDRFERVFPNAQVRCLTGDREFVGKDWCSYLLLPKTLPFRLRLRHSDQISSRSGQSRQGVFRDLMPTLTARWAQRERPIPASVVHARQHFEQIWAADGSVLEALFRKLKSLQDCPAGQLAGKICTVIDRGSQLPVAVWFTEDAKAHDAQFLDRLLALATAKTLLILDRGFYDQS